MAQGLYLGDKKELPLSDSIQKNVDFRNPVENKGSLDLFFDLRLSIDISMNVKIRPERMRTPYIISIKKVGAFASNNKFLVHRKLRAAPIQDCPE